MAEADRMVGHMAGEVAVFARLEHAPAIAVAVIPGGRAPCGCAGA